MTQRVSDVSSLAPGALRYRTARPLASLAVLMFSTLMVLVLTASVEGRVLALASPQSPVVMAADETLASLARSVATAPEVDPGFLGSAWRVRVATGLIVLGMVLVLGGVLWAMDRAAPADAGPSDERAQ